MLASKLGMEHFDARYPRSKPRSSLIHDPEAMHLVVTVHMQGGSIVQVVA